MLRAALARLRGLFASEDDEDRYDGTGEVYLDPAYNGRYEAERELRRLSKAAAEHDEREGEEP